MLKRVTGLFHEHLLSIDHLEKITRSSFCLVLNPFCVAILHCSVTSSDKEWNWLLLELFQTVSRDCFLLERLMFAIQQVLR